MEIRNKSFLGGLDQPNLYTKSLNFSTSPFPKSPCFYFILFYFSGFCQVAHFLFQATGGSCITEREREREREMAALLLPVNLSFPPLPPAAASFGFSSFSRSLFPINHRIPAKSIPVLHSQSNLTFPFPGKVKPSSLNLTLFAFRQKPWDSYSVPYCFVTFC
jgi:hypothetical protein